MQSPNRKKVVALSKKYPLMDLETKNIGVCIWYMSFTLSLLIKSSSELYKFWKNS